MEDCTAITVVDDPEGSRVRVEPISPGRAFLLGAPLDLNRAGIRELTLLPGVGPATARKIAAERMVRGPFGSPEDLRRVRGIPVRVLEGIRPLVTAQGGKDLREIRDSRHEIRSRVE